MAPQLTALLWLGALSLANAGGRSVMIWQMASSDEVVADIRAHRENLTAVSPLLYQFDAAGNFIHQQWYKGVFPWLSNYSDMGLDIVPLIGQNGGVAGMVRLGQKFIDDAIAEALKMGYKGYNFDNELRGGSTESSWAPLVPHAATWMSFLNSFADALHSHNLTLSVDIEGCCGWVDEAHPGAPAGHCLNAFAKYEFVATNCAMYKASHLDRVYGMATYSTMINGNGTFNTSRHFGPDTLFALAMNDQQAIGADKYCTASKGGWPYCTDWSNASTCIFDDVAKKSIRRLRDEMGIQHLSHWHDGANHMPSQAEWDVWGFFLHDESPLGSSTVVV